MAFIEALGERVRREFIPITAAAASKASADRAQSLGIQVVPLETLGTVDLAVDGADRVDPRGTLIKGGGAALVRERLIIASARQVFILVDASKPVDRLQDVVVPLAILPFGWRQTLVRLQDAVAQVSLREHAGQPVMTDDGLFVADARIHDLTDPEGWHVRLKMVPGVVDTGIFTGYEPQVWVSHGTGDGPQRWA